MVFGYVAEQMGILDILAPRKRKKEAERKQRDAMLAQKLRQEEEEEAQRKLRQKKRKEEMQIKLELEAERKGLFAKKQNVMYYHKLSDTTYYAQVVGVHFDDGPDKPYYTIKYEKSETTIDEKGLEQKNTHMIEKQTTPDRLIRISRHEEGHEVTK